ncbi:MAG: peptidylprolyl isomerase, partial [Planctomycetaceae bacterium]|nr:peptidylprolyl isomerase [Planctomycetaceae bacterium]
MSETLRTLFTGSGSFSDRLIDVIDELFDPARPAKHPFRRSFVFEPLEERVVLNVAPVFVDLPTEITVIAGESFHLALNGYDADGDALVFSTSSNLADVLTGNSSVSMRIVQRDAAGNIIQDFGYITFELFEGEVPVTTARIKEIIESGFYENKLFHRIIDGFMIQGGSSDGYGSQGTGYEFADEFSELLRHNRNGMISMANRGPNTNDSQFFVTDGATEWLDDLHSIFGFLTSGYDVLAKVSTIKTQGGGNANPDKDRPIFDVFMEEVTVFNDTRNGTLRIQTDAGMAGTTQHITVMVDDGNGGQTEQTIKVNVATLPAHPLFEVPDIVEIQAGESLIVDFPKIAGIPSHQIEYFVEAWEYSHPGMKYEITAD